MLVHLLEISIFNHQLGCRFDILDSISSFFCILTYAIIYVLIHHIILWLYLYSLNILYFSSILVLTSSIDVVFVLVIPIWLFGILKMLYNIGCICLYFTDNDNTAKHYTITYIQWIRIHLPTHIYRYLCSECGMSPEPVSISRPSFQI